MAAVERLIVSIHLGNQEEELGELIQDGKRIYFKYYPAFLKRGLEISPLKLKSSTQIYTAPDLPFDGLFGVFSDSFPDGWGRLLLDRALTAKGIAVEDLSPLDRLAYVGAHGPGALIYRPAQETDTTSTAHLELDALAQSSQEIMAGSSSDVLEELYLLGGSSGGARPKILVGYHPNKRHLVAGTTALPVGYEHWIIKFSAQLDPVDMAHIEYAYALMAADAGIEMSETRLFQGRSGHMYFGTKRFDREGDERLHLHSAAGLMHDNFRFSNLDYGHLMDAAFQLERHVHAYEKILRLAAFNVFAHNRDDHSKNFSFLMDAKGQWRFAPAYDLTFSSSTHGFHSTMIAGESKQPSEEHLLKLANYFKVKKANMIIEQVRDVVADWKTYARKAGVEKESEKKIARVLGRL